MWKYLLKRAMMLVCMIFIVSFIVYALMDLTPGDPVLSVVGEGMTEEQIEEVREQMGYNDPLITRYVRYMSGVFRGDLGQSIYGNNDDVWDLFMYRLPYTFWLAVVSILITIAISVPFGIIAATHENTLLDNITSSIAIMGLSVPGFWLGMMLVLLFSIILGWLPSMGADGFKSVLMPAFTLGVGNAALSTRITRSSMLEVLRQDYLRTARAKGVAERKVVLKHALRNALLPVITIIGSQFSILFSGAVVVESIFAWPGIGSLLLNGIRGNDVTVVTGTTILVSVITGIILLAVDLLYAVVDPRVRSSYANS